jgi:hypothetical protein
MRAVLIISLLIIAVPAFAQERPLPELQPFVQEVRKHLQTDEQLQSQYTYVETRRQQKLDKSGQPTGESVKVYESYPGFPGQRRRWERLIEEDGRPVPAAELVKRDRDRQKAAEEYARRLATQTAEDRAKEAREREKRRRRAAEEVDDAFRIFDIRMLGREAVEGHDTIVFSLTPRPNVKPRTDDGKIMRHFKGRAWVSESEYELVRLEVEAIDTISFGLGLLARVHKGSKASFQRRKVNDEEWLPARATYTASARLLLLKMMRVGGTSEFSNYRKFTVETSTTYAPPRPPQD